MKTKLPYEIPRDFAFNTDSIYESRQDKLERKRFWPIVIWTAIFATIINWVIIAIMVSDCIHHA